MWVCYSPRFLQGTEADEIPRGRPEVPPVPLPKGSTAFPEGELCLPGVTQDVSGSLQETPVSGLLTALPCVTHPSDSPPLPWRLLRAFQLRTVRSIAMNTFYSPLKKQFCSGSQTSRMTKTNFTRTLSLYLMHVCVHLYTLSQAHTHLCWGHTRNTSLGHNTHTHCPE